MELFNAIQSENLEEIVRILGANPELANTPDQRGFTPLVLATYLGKEAVTEMLIENGADINGQDASGNTALMGVSFKGNDRIVEMLIEKGATVDLQNKNGDSALDFAKQGKHTAIEELLSGFVTSK